MAERLPAPFYADLIGAPYCDGGRGPVAFDCLGIVLELLSRQGAIVPEYASTIEQLHRSFSTKGVLGICREIPVVRPGCVVLLSSFGAATGVHLGIMVDRFTMIHASESARSVVLEKMRGSRWERRVLGFYIPAGGAH